MVKTDSGFLGRCSSQISIAGPHRFKENNLKTALETPKFTSDLFKFRDRETKSRNRKCHRRGNSTSSHTNLQPVTKAADACTDINEWNENLVGSLAQMDGQDSNHPT